MLYLITFFMYVVSCVIIYFLNDVFVIIPLCFSFGVLMTALTTLPYQMLSEFHEDEAYVNENKDGVKRGLGTDCALLCSCFFLGQTITSTFISFLTASLGNRIILVVAAIFGAIAFFLAMFVVIYPKNNAATRSKEEAVQMSTLKIELQ